MKSNLDIILARQASIGEIKLHSFDFLAEEVPWRSQITQADAKTESFPLKTESGFPSLRKISTQLNDCREIELWLV